MANYTLKIATFYQLDEIVGTIDYLEQSFVGLLGTTLADYLSTPRVDVDEELARNKLAAILAFNSFFANSNQNQSGNPFQSIYNSNRNDVVSQQALCRSFLLTTEYLESKNVNIATALSNGLLIEAISVSFTSQELQLVLESINWIYNDNEYYSPSQMPIAAEIIAKLS